MCGRQDFFVSPHYFYTLSFSIKPLSLSSAHSCPVSHYFSQYPLQLGVVWNVRRYVSNFGAMSLKGHLFHSHMLEQWVNLPLVDENHVQGNRAATELVKPRNFGDHLKQNHLPVQTFIQMRINFSSCQSYCFLIY